MPLKRTACKAVARNTPRWHAYCGSPQMMIQTGAEAAYARLPSFFLAPRGAARRPSRSILDFDEIPVSDSIFVSTQIRDVGNARLRHTGIWRTERPVIDASKCKRCFLCYLYCPDGAISLDEQHFPHLDYDHCKGCLICYEECPPRAISFGLEEQEHGA